MSRSSCVYRSIAILICSKVVHFLNIFYFLRMEGLCKILIVHLLRPIVNSQTSCLCLFCVCWSKIVEWQRRGGWCIPITDGRNGNKPTIFPPFHDLELLVQRKKTKSGYKHPKLRIKFDNEVSHRQRFSLGLYIYIVSLEARRCLSCLSVK